MNTKHVVVIINYNLNIPRLNTSQDLGPLMSLVIDLKNEVI